MGVQKRIPERKIQKLPIANVHLDDLQMVAEAFESVGVEPAILTRTFKVDEVEDLRDVPIVEAKRVAIGQPDGPLRLSLGTPSQLAWNDDQTEVFQPVIDQIVDHWENIKSSQWIDSLFGALVMVGLTTLVLALAAVAKGELRLGLAWPVWLAITFAIGVVVASYVVQNPRFVSEYRASRGPSMWARNVSSLSENWLVIGVTLLLGVPVTVVVTLLLRGGK